MKRTSPKHCLTIELCATVFGFRRLWIPTVGLSMRVMGFKSFPSDFTFQVRQLLWVPPRLIFEDHITTIRCICVLCTITQNSEYSPYCTERLSCLRYGMKRVWFVRSFLPSFFGGSLVFYFRVHEINTK